VISRLWRRLVPAVRVEAREVEGPPAPAETTIRDDLADVRFEPASENIVLEHITATNVDFSGRRFWSFTADDCRFIGCDFSEVVVEWLPFASGGSLFRDCRFDRARIGDFGDVRLERCQFVDAQLDGWFTRSADLVDCRFAGHLQGVVFTGRDLDERRTNEFAGNDFREAELDDVAFRFGIDLDAQLLPETDDYIRLRDIGGRVRRTREQVRKWPNDAEREAALWMLEVVETVHEDEPDVFSKREFLIDMADSPEIGGRVLELLSSPEDRPD
jgi:hypothetical protein